MEEEKTIDTNQPREDIRPSQDKKGMPKVVKLLIVLILLALAAGAGWWWQNQQSQQVIKDKNDKITRLEKDLSEADQTDSNQSAEEEAVKPVVVFSPGGLFNQAETDELTKKMVNPLGDYYLENESPVVSIHVQMYDGGTYKYTVDVIHQNGQYSGFLFGQSEPLEWWKPECLNACTFSDEYKAKYPDVVE